MRQVVPGLSYIFDACWSQPINSDAVAGNAWGSAIPGPILVQAAPTDIFPTGAHAVADLSLWFLIMTIREL